MERGQHMKKSLALFILIVFAAALIGCSGGGGQDVAEDVALQAQESLEEAENTGIEVSLGETGENLSLPDDYPDEVFPLPEDANIVNVNADGASNAMGIIFTTGMTFDEAAEYCKDILKDGNITVEDKRDDSFILMGDKDQYGIMITISKYDGEKISILFNVNTI